MTLVRNVVGGQRVGSGASELVAMLDDVAMEAKEDNIAVVSTKDVIVALRDTASKCLESLKTLAGWCGNMDAFW